MAPNINIEDSDPRPRTSGDKGVNVTYWTHPGSATDVSPQDSYTGNGVSDVYRVEWKIPLKYRLALWIHTLREQAPWILLGVAAGIGAGIWGVKEGLF